MMDTNIAEELRKSTLINLHTVISKKTCMYLALIIVIDILLFHSDGEEDEDELNSLFDFDNAIFPSTILTPNFNEHSHSKTH